MDVVLLWTLSLLCSGHSRQKNVFMYGCGANEPNRPAQIQGWSLCHLRFLASCPLSQASALSSVVVPGKIYPFMLWKNADIFSFDGCNFDVQKSKASTARVVYWREYGISNSFTIEVRSPHMFSSSCICGIFVPSSTQLYVFCGATSKQASFAGADFGIYDGVHFNTAMLEQVRLIPQEKTKDNHLTNVSALFVIGVSHRWATTSVTLS